MNEYRKKYIDILKDIIKHISSDDISVDYIKKSIKEYDNTDSTKSDPYRFALVDVLETIHKELSTNKDMLKYQTLFEMRYISKIPVRNIAKILKCSVSKTYNDLNTGIVYLTYKTQVYNTLRWEYGKTNFIKFCGWLGWKFNVIQSKEFNEINLSLYLKTTELPAYIKDLIFYDILNNSIIQSYTQRENANLKRRYETTLSAVPRIKNIYEYGSVNAYMDYLEDKITCIENNEENEVMKKC